MNPEIEAKQLIEKYLKVITDRTDVFNAYSDLSFAKDCAYICAERSEQLIYTTPISDSTFDYRKNQLEYWQRVKEIIKEKL